jgi:probable HAF family extracellular repeat protein
MKRSIGRNAAAAAMLAAVVAVARPAPMKAAATAKYDIRYLSGLGGHHTRGNSINGAGWIAGYSNLTDDKYRHATLWLNDSPIDLGTLGSANRPKNSNVVWPVKNTIGLVVGISQTDAPDPWGEAWSCSAFFTAGTETGFRCLGFVWENGVMRPLPTLGGTHGYAAAANNQRQIVGWAENRVRDNTCTSPQIFQFRAVVWGPSGNQIHELPIVAGDTSSAATAINDRGQIVGISGTCDVAIGAGTGLHAVLWENGGVEALPTMGGVQFNTPTAINERGDVAGFMDHAGDVVTEAFFWNRAVGLKPLGFLYSNDVLSEAFGMNDRQQVVGLSCNPACRAFVWQDGVMSDLNLLIPPDDSVVLTHAMDINNDGVITGRATIRATGERVAFVATPNPAAVASREESAHGRPRVDIMLSDEALREILHPLGPGAERLHAR